MNAQRLNPAYAAAVALVSVLALASAAGCGGSGQATANPTTPATTTQAAIVTVAPPTRSALPDGVKLRAGHTNAHQQSS